MIFSKLPKQHNSKMSTPKPASNIMTPEEEEQLEALARQRYSQRRPAFYISNGNTGISGPISKTKAQNGKEESSSNEIVVRQSSRLIVGYADTMGKRPSMEDDMAIVGNLRDREDEDYVAIFDGHGGREVSSYAAKNLYKILSKNLDSDENPEKSIRNSFFQINDVIKNENLRGGSTALVAFFTSQKCYIANAGDSRAVLCQGDKAIRLSVDHKPDDPAEESRIKSVGGSVTRQVNRQGKTISRVGGMLAVSRALGDIFLLPYVTPEPDIKEFDLHSPQNQYLILACDGLWDVISDDEALEIIKDISDPEEAAIKLRDQALQRSSTDNISVIVIKLPPNSQGKIKETSSIAPSSPSRSRSFLSLSKPSWNQWPMYVFGISLCIFLLRYIFGSQ